MKLKNVLIVGVLSGIVFTSCRDNQSGTTVDDEVRLESDRTDTDLRTNDTRGTDNNVSARLQRNQNLTTFNEGMNKNQINQNWNRQSTTAGTTSARTGTTAGTTTGTNPETGTTTGTTAGTATGTTTAQGTTAQGQVVTIFAPSNDAYAQLPENQRTQMMDPQNLDRNTASMNYLMVEGRYTEDQLREQIKNSNGNYTIKTMQGENLTASMDGNNIVLKDAAGNQARITESDNEASDGVIHVIDRVLMPKDPSKNQSATGTRTGTSGTGTSTN